MPSHGRSRCTDLAARHATIRLCPVFENGRIYATLQNADFKGNTKESNQPFSTLKIRGAATGHAEHDARTSLQHFIDQQRIAYFKQPRCLWNMLQTNRVNILYQLLLKIEKAEPAGRQTGPTRSFWDEKAKETQTAYRLCQVVP